MTDEHERLHGALAKIKELQTLLDATMQTVAVQATEIDRLHSQLNRQEIERLRAAERADSLRAQIETLQNELRIWRNQ